MISLSLVPTHAVADWLIKHIDHLLDALGLEKSPTIEEVIYIVLIAAVSFGIGVLVKKGVLFITQKAVDIRNVSVGRQLLREGTLTKCSHIIPPLVFMALIPFVFSSETGLLSWVMRLIGVYTLIALAIGLCAILTFVFNRYNAHENTKNLPLKGILNVGKGIVWIVILIIVVSVLIDKSPGTLLAGLGAFAAALMLIFKDSILGFVAGIQMSENDMLHVGDWIIVPGTPANGTVMDVSLSTVKVRNFDMTLVMVPPYTLVSTSFQNYRGMVETGVRRIMRTFLIDIPTITDVTEPMLDAVIAKYPEMKTFVDGLRRAGRTAATNSGERPENGTIRTNLGLFRAYISLYLMSHPKIAKDQRILVRVLESNSDGLPLEIWCFTATTNWDEYEGIQSEVIEHLTTVVGDFGGLAIYTSSSLTVDGTIEQPTLAAPTPQVKSPSE